MKAKEILIRAAKTSVQAAVAAVGTASLFEVDWKPLVSVAILAGVNSIINNNAVNYIAGDEKEGRTADEIYKEMLAADMEDAKEIKAE